MPFQSVRFALSAACIAAVSMPSLAADAPTLVKVQLKTGRTVVGELQEQTATQIKLRDFKSGKEITYAKGDLSKVRTDVADNEVVASVGLPAFVAWKCGRHQQTATGKIADIKPTAVYVTLGAKSGIAKGRMLIVYRDEGELKDPDTGDVLERQRAKIAQLEVTDAREKYSKAKLLGDLEVQLRVGDVVETDRGTEIVAVVPPVNEEGNRTSVGETLAEELTTALVGRGIKVVERTLLGEVLDELDLRGLFEDQTITRKVGKQLGASAILTGRLVESGRFLSVHVRLIDVATGEVLLAASQKTTGDAGDEYDAPEATRRPAPTDEGGTAASPTRRGTDESRVRWLNATYNTTVRYVKAKKVWEEVDNKTGRVTWVDKETARTGDYIQVFSPERKSELRLRPERMEQKLNGKWEWVANGHWADN